MKVKRSGNVIEVSGAWYDLVFDTEQLRARLEVRAGELYYYMSLLTAVDVVGRADETQGIEKPQVTEEQDCCVVEIVQQSSIWQKKVLVYECWEDRLSSLEQGPADAVVGGRSSGDGGSIRVPEL